jgi:hypothetical protein
LNAFGKTVVTLVKKTLKKRGEMMKLGKKSYKNAYDKELGVARLTYSKIHGIYCSLRLFADSVAKFKEGALKSALGRLVLLFSIDQMLLFSSDIFAAGAVAAED